MKQRRMTFFSGLILIIIMFMSACSNEGKTDRSQQKDVPVSKNEEKQNTTEESNNSRSTESILKQLSDVPPEPKTLEEIVNYPIGKLGKLSSAKEEEKQIMIEEVKKLPDLSNVTDEKAIEKYWENLLALFAREYADPQHLFEEMKALSFGSPEITDSRYQFKDQLNVEIILDSSGSMAGKINGRSKMDLAKEAINQFISTLPKDANVALRVYGHKGTGKDSDKNLSCNSNELLYSFSPYDGGKFNQVMSQFKPAGWTPLATAIMKAKEDLSNYPSESNTNIIYVVSDGIETCDGNPVEAAKAIKDSNVKPIVNVIGFDLDSKGQKQLKEVAEAADGVYTNVTDQSGLQKEFDKTIEIAKKWEKWKEDANIEAFLARVDRDFLIMGFTNDWGDSIFSEDLNYLSILLYLRDEEKLSKEAEQILRERYEARTDRLYALRAQVEADLQQLNQMTYEQMQKEIEEKYKNQAN